jgi:hypothetical protein
LSSLFSSDRRKPRPIHRIAYPISLRGVFVWRWLTSITAMHPPIAANCRVYGINFYEAVVARQAAATCGQGTERQRILDALDSEINVFNGLIAAQCAI